MEYGEYQRCSREFLEEKDATARRHMTEYEKMKKETLKRIREEELARAESLLLAPKAKLVLLKQQLMDLEQEVGDALTILCQEFESNYMEIIEANKAHYNGYFAQVCRVRHPPFITLAEAMDETRPKF